MLLPRICHASGSLRLPSLSSRLSAPVHPLVSAPGQRGMSDSAEKKGGMLDRVFGLESNTAKEGTNRWTMFLPAFCTHVALGAPYGWSAISAQLTRENGLVTSAASDWALDLASYPMSIMIAAGGISAAVMGKWTIKVRPNLYSDLKHYLHVCLSKAFEVN